MRIGIAVVCTICHQMKAPHGRSVPMGASYCTEECEGYELDPHVGCLWPRETSKDFGYQHCDKGTVEIDEE